MDLKTAIEEINALRIHTNDKKSLALLEKWNLLLIEILSFDLTTIERETIEIELAVHINKFKQNNITAGLVKTALKSFLKTSKSVLNAKDSHKFTLIGIFIGFLLSILVDIHVLLCVLLGVVAGFAVDYFINKSQRSIRVNLHDTW